jgi:ABC-type lipoprotein export system ATPase subunit/ABC-type antimicrobial peptide transport system permease subunit
MELIRCENITKTYHVGEIDVPVLKGVSFSIRRGELVALMGASGSGKTTLMNILGCLDRPTSGEYWLDGQEISKLSSDSRALVRTAKLGFVFQSFNLLARTTAVNNVLMPLDYSTTRRSPTVASNRAHDLLERVGLGERLDHVPSQMSGGQQQRVAIARALINQPAVLLGDEPTGNLDSKTSVEILEMFQELNAQGITVIIVTHDPKVADYAHRVIHVKDGLIEEDVTKPPGSRVRLPVPHLPSLTHSNGHNGNGHDSNGHGSNGHGAASNGNGHTHEAHGTGAGPNHGGDWNSGSDTGGGGSGGSTQTATRVDRRVLAVAEAEPAVEIAGDEIDDEAAEEAKPQKQRHHSVPGHLSALLIPATVRTAVGSLRRNLMRSALTTLGIIIGVAAVIAIFEISSGSREALVKTMSSMGANMLIVQSGAAASGGVSWGTGSEKTLTPDDAIQIGEQCTAVIAVAPIVQANGQVVYGNRNWIPANMSGTTPDYLIVRDWQELAEGEMFTQRDVLASNKVCVIGLTLAKELFQGESPIGKDVRVSNVSLRVVGVLGRKGGSMMGMDQDDVLIAPWTTMKYRVTGAGGAAAAAAAATASTPGYDKVNSLNQLYPGSTKLYAEQSMSQKANMPMPIRFTNVDTILVKAASAERAGEAIAEINSLLHERHRIREGQDDDFTIRDMAEIINAMSSMTKMMGGLLMIVAMISLAVGGVGIMNIMLVSVTERTREIGLRMAVGARAKHILRQFLIESVVLCLFGGALGILLGRGATFLVWFFLRWPVSASVPAILAAFAVSAGVGIAFGFYPAWKASRLDPIDALRYE